MFSTISTSCNMSVLYAGIMTLSSFSFNISASNLAPSSSLLTSSASRSVPPINSFATSTWTFLSFGVKSGDTKVSSSYTISMDLILPPTSANEEHIMFKAWFTAFSSVPVTSTIMFFVSSESFVNSPLMIGGIDRTLLSLSRIKGYLSNLSIKWAYFSPFWFFSRISSGVSSSPISRGTKAFSVFSVAM